MRGFGVVMGRGHKLSVLCKQCWCQSQREEKAEEVCVEEGFAPVPAVSCVG